MGYSMITITFRPAGLFVNGIFAETSLLKAESYLGAAPVAVTAKNESCRIMALHPHRGWVGSMISENCTWVEVRLASIVFWGKRPRSATKKA
jgi:hypothetical protein